MRPTFVVTAAVLLLSIGTANAADSTQLAETDGFLLGSAHRCSVPTDRVEHARNVIHDLIVAASDDSTEEAAADSHFAQMFMASSSASRHKLTSTPGYVMRPVAAIIVGLVAVVIVLAHAPPILTKSDLFDRCKSNLPI